MDYNGRFNLRNSSALLNRFVVAIEEIAMGILSEDPTTTDHAARVVWARSVIKDRGTAQGYADMALRLAIHTPTMQAVGEAVPDAGIQSICASLVGAFTVAVTTP